MSKIIVGMSGGVDSSVSAYLLKQAGHEVIGLFMRNWDSFVNKDVLGNSNDQSAPCPQEVDYLDAKKVAKQIDIPLHRIDFVDEYWNKVFKKFIDDYKNGYTPNPDILCNKYIKFDVFLKYCLKKFKGDYIAMGHYAKTKKGLLFEAKDINKDQTYFLSQLTKKQLEQVIFPLENLKKSEVRAIATQQNLITANKKDSTGICFIGERKFQKFLENYIPSKKGNIVDITTKKIIGQHIGTMYYTIGQRKGLNLGGMNEPFYVAGHNLKEKIIFVAPNSDRTFLKSNKCILENVNIIGDEKKLLKSNIYAKFRYRQKKQKIKIEKSNEQYIVRYPQTIEAVAPGQQCVFYVNNQCFGGGTIKKTFFNNEERVFFN